MVMRWLRWRRGCGRLLSSSLLSNCGLAILSLPVAGLDLSFTALLGTGVFVIRGAGCMINNLWDRDVDGRITQTRVRPLVSGDVTPPRSATFLYAQLSLGLGLHWRGQDHSDGGAQKEQMHACGVVNTN